MNTPDTNSLDYAEGYDVGYNKGYDDGYEEAKLETDDYYSGWDDGYSEGIGKANTINSYAILSIIKETQEYFMKMRDRDPHDVEFLEALERYMP